MQKRILARKENRTSFLGGFFNRGELYGAFVVFGKRMLYDKRKGGESDGYDENGRITEPFAEGTRHDTKAGGRKLEPLQAQPMEGRHEVQIEESEQEYFITFSHEMEKEHYIAFAALVSWDRVTVVHLCPELSGEVRIPRQRRGERYLCCNQHGLFYKRI